MVSVGCRHMLVLLKYLRALLVLAVLMLLLLCTTPGFAHERGRTAGGVNKAMGKHDGNSTRLQQFRVVPSFAAPLCLVVSHPRTCLFRAVFCAPPTQSMPRAYLLVYDITRGRDPPPAPDPAIHLPNNVGGGKLNLFGGVMNNALTCEAHAYIAHRGHTCEGVTN